MPGNFINKKLNWETDKDYTKRLESDLVGLKEELSKTKSVVQELKNTIKKLQDEKHYYFNNNVEKLQKENEELKISNNQMKSSAIMKENAELHNIISQKDHEWKKKIYKAVSPFIDSDVWEEIRTELEIKED